MLTFQNIYTYTSQNHHSTYIAARDLVLHLSRFIQNK
jgi:hypothetical protein